MTTLATKPAAANDYFSSPGPVRDRQHGFKYNGRSGSSASVGGGAATTLGTTSRAREGWEEHCRAEQRTYDDERRRAARGSIAREGGDE